MKIVAYYRVSTATQGRSGLGLEAQKEGVRQFCRGRDCNMLAEFVEVESGKRDDRPQLARALHHAKLTGATLVIAKLDRLSRNLTFLSALQDGKVKFVAADMPEANETMVQFMAVMAQAERQAISRRTKEALQAAKARGQKLGNPNGTAAIRRAGKGTTAALQAKQRNADAHAERLGPIIQRMRGEGHTSLGALAKALNEEGMVTPRGARWHASSVRNLLARLGD